MIPRLVLLLVAVFWVVMNALLWRAEYSSRSTGLSVPADLVWQKILTAPDPSSLTIYRNGKRCGFCQFATSVEQAMSALEEDTLPPEGLLKRAGYQIRFDGNVNIGEFTNRFAFNGRIQFQSSRDWRELYLKVSARGDAVEIRALAASRMVHLNLISGGAVVEREFTFAELQNPGALLRSLAGDLDGGGAGGPDWFPQLQVAGLPKVELHWEARLDRRMIGSEPVSVYRLETRALDYPIVIYASTLGEILRVELPGGIIAVLDQFGST